MGLQRYMHQYNEVELSALGMGTVFLTMMLLLKFSIVYLCIYACELFAYTIFVLSASFVPGIDHSTKKLNSLGAG